MDYRLQETRKSIKVERTSSDEVVNNYGVHYHESQSYDSASVDDSDVKEHNTSGLPLKLASYKLGDREVVTLPDVYEAVRNLCGSCSSVQGTLGKLGITANRFSPFELTRLKQIQGVNPGAKCCSYILVNELEHLLTRLDTQYGYNCQALIQVLPSTLLDVVRHSQAADSRNSIQVSSSSYCQPSSSKITSLPEMLRIHTFMLDDQVIIDYAHIQTNFELLFKNSVSFDECIARLAINSIAYSRDGDVSTMKLFVTQRDASRMLQYAGALTNVDTTNIKWIKPRKLSSVDVSGSSSRRNSDVTNESPRKEQLIRNTNVGTELDVAHDNGTLFHIADKTVQNISFHNSLREPACTTVEARQFSVPDLSVGFHDKNKQTIMRPNIVSEGMSQNLESDDMTGTSNCHTVDDNEIHTTEIYDDSITSITLNTACNYEEDCADSGYTVRTFEINGEIVVCIPDIHKVIISLYGQSVQVGYYMNRLNIITHRFSHTHVKQLKQHNVLSLKATVCTYISKTDAQKLIKMYDAINVNGKSEKVYWAEPIVLEDLCFEQSRESIRDDAMLSESESPYPLELTQASNVKIPTFIIEGAVVVSMPDVHKAVQIVNGQSVQLRYNLEKLGIVKRKYTYSQVYLLKAFSGLKRPSMCTFILKSDVDRLLGLYLTPEKRPRLNYIEWQPPVRLEDLNQDQSSYVESDVGEQETNSVLAESTQQDRPSDDEAQYSVTGSGLPGDDESSECNSGQALEHCDDKSLSSDDTHNSKPEAAQHICTTSVGESSNKPSFHQTDILHQNIPRVTGGPQREAFCTTHSPGLPVASSTLCMQVGKEQRPCLHSEVMCYSQKRLLDLSSQNEQLEATAKRLKADNEEHVKTVQRKETEMKILHDAYQHQIEIEREKREKAEKETAELKASNEELLKNLQRKESEMKILHDSYQLQILHEKEKRENIEKYLNDLQGTRGKDLEITETK